MQGENTYVRTYTCLNGDDCAIYTHKILRSYEALLLTESFRNQNGHDRRDFQSVVYVSLLTKTSKRRFKQIYVLKSYESYYTTYPGHPSSIQSQNVR